jgi:hypothetical protein
MRTAILVLVALLCAASCVDACWLAFMSDALCPPRPTTTRATRGREFTPRPASITLAPQSIWNFHGKNLCYCSSALRGTGLLTAVRCSIPGCAKWDESHQMYCQTYTEGGATKYYPPECKNWKVIVGTRAPKPKTSRPAAPAL